MKIHIAVDVKSKKIISMKVTDEHIHDSKMLPKIVDAIAKSKHVTVDKIIADGAYDSNAAVFKCLADSGILPRIKVRKNTKLKKTNHFLRNLLVISQKKNGLQRWKYGVSYGQRWIAETVFSCIKRTFEREYVYSVRQNNMIQEMVLKASLYNKIDI